MDILNPILTFYYEADALSPSKIKLAKDMAMLNTILTYFNLLGDQGSISQQDEASKMHEYA